jgi:hypothetical protein
MDKIYYEDVDIDSQTDTVCRFFFFFAFFVFGVFNFEFLFYFNDSLFVCIHFYKEEIELNESEMSISKFEIENFAALCGSSS